MIIQITNFLLCVRSIILKKNCNHHYNDDSSYKFSLVCNRSKALVQLVGQGLVISHCPSARFIIRTLTASYQLMAASLNHHSQDLVARAVIRGYYY